MERLLAELKDFGVKLRLDGEELRVSAPPGALTDELRTQLKSKKRELVELLRASAIAADEPLPAVQADPLRRHEPFPLTDLQHAYWLGRDAALEMGDVATHLYVELDCAPLDLGRLEDALDRMIARHDMLRAVVLPDGTQRVLPEVPRYRIAVQDRRGATAEEGEAAALAAREALSHQVLKPDRWPLFEVRATVLPGERVRLHLSLDLLILDAFSIFMLLRDWYREYERPGSAGAEPGIGFRDYALADRSLEKTEAYRRARAYWMERVEGLPPAPELPLRPDAAARSAPRFHRHEARIPRARWEPLKAAARAKGLTPSGLLVAVYAEVLARFSRSPHFTLNVTVSNRRAFHPDVNRLLGDFTSLSMLEVDRRDRGRTFLEFARANQQRFLTDLQHNQLGGVKVMQEWNRRHGIRLQASMPVVFSSGLIWTGDEEVGDLEQFGKKIFSVSQTSQVWLDHHVMELQKDLVLIWDAADAVFEPGAVDEMFAAYVRTLERLCAEPALWESRDPVALDEATERRRVECNRTAAPEPEDRLHGAFVRRALQDPTRAAVIAPARTLSAGELLAEACGVANQLLEGGVTPGEPVAVVMRKGWEQAVAAYGALLAGAAYLPIDADLPARRQEELLELGGVTQILTQPGALRAGARTREEKPRRVLTVDGSARGEFGPAHARSLSGPADRLAYVIFTSGTTGTPKGVMIDHRGAANTVAHVNGMFRVSPLDRVLGVSSLSFDLSVYDLFGLLGAGGAVVLPDVRKEHDPVHWRELMTAHRVSIWNSAPQLMRMLMDGAGAVRPLAGAGDARQGDALRTVLLSGDFIPLDLPDRIRAAHPRAEVVSLGGATEASIWSNFHRIGAVDPAWGSIPYGRPLPNQTMWVLDHALRPCPDHVRGRIYIGGVGLAQGYFGDPEKTAAAFRMHPETKERLYDTGDLGKYAPDGDIVILGRDDGQVKLRGHRIELGEIEAALRQHPRVQAAVVQAVPSASEERRLVAFVTATDGEAEVDVLELKAHLQERLPAYMVPQAIVPLAELPLSTNGKVDHQALAALLEATQGEAREVVAPRSDVERTILGAWSELMPGAAIGVTDNFFELGGDSVLATQLVRRLNDALPAFQLQMHELFENLTIEALAALLAARGDAPSEQGAQREQVPAEPAVPAGDLLRRDVEGALSALEQVALAPSAADAAAPRSILVTGATGWVGAHLVAELLAATEARIHCLVRTASPEEGRERLAAALAERGIGLDAAQRARLVPVCGDLTAPGLGLATAAWRALAAEIDVVYHAGASVNVLLDYAAHRKVNVLPLVPLLRLAAEGRVKTLFALSPMTVCRRRVEGKLTVLGDERAHAEPEGLLTGYAQSKWVAEQILVGAAARGFPVRIYRTSHALPSARSGLAKAGDTYGSVLRVAVAADVLPTWGESGVFGVPVDRLAELVVRSSLRGGPAAGEVVHLENRSPPTVEEVVGALLAARRGSEPSARPAARVAFDEWKARCREAAERLQGEEAALARSLFAERGWGAGVENLFTRQPIEIAWFERHGEAGELADLTPAAYWRTVYEAARW